MLLNDFPLSGGIGNAVLGGLATTGVESFDPSSLVLHAERTRIAKASVSNNAPKNGHRLLCEFDGAGVLVC